MYARHRSFALLAVSAAVGLSPAAAHAASFTVSATTDAVDAASGDGTCATAAGVCTLRAAVQEADAVGGKSTITVPAGIYRLTIKPAIEAGSAADMDPANGDLDLNADITVQGAGVGRTVLDGGGIDRVFETGASVAAQLRDVTITHGDATADGSQEIDLGGGILNKSGIVLERVALIDNVADGGGGMFSIPGTMPTIRDSLVTGNQAFEGGGLRIDQGATIVNTTITGNTLRAPRPIQEKPVGIVIPAVDEISGYGGGIDHRGGGLLTIINSTITDNHALKGGGGVGAGQDYVPLIEQLPLGKVMLRNTIIAGNTSAAGAAECRTNKVPFVSLGHNLAGDGSCFLDGPGDRPGTDPRLAPLADNGGPVRTQAPLAGSPAIDGGSDAGCPPVDARGTARPQGLRCDIGAVEVVPVSASPGCVRTVRLPARLRGVARSFDVLVGGKVVARRRRPARPVVLRGLTSASRVVLRVHLRSGRTVRVAMPTTCRRS